MIKRMNEIRNHEGELTHKMCCFCFRTIPISELHVDETGQKWDSCGADETACSPSFA